MEDGRIIFSSQAFFDRQETVLVTYDLSPAIAARQADLDAGAMTQEVVDSIKQLVTTLVHPELGPTTAANFGGLVLTPSSVQVG